MCAVTLLWSLAVQALTAKIHRNVTADLCSTSAPAGCASVPPCSRGWMCSECTFNVCAVNAHSRGPLISADGTCAVTTRVVRQLSLYNFPVCCQASTCATPSHVLAVRLKYMHMADSAGCVAAYRLALLHVSPASCQTLCQVRSGRWVCWASPQHRCMQAQAAAAGTAVRRLHIDTASQGSMLGFCARYSHATRFSLYTFQRHQTHFQTVFRAFCRTCRHMARPPILLLACSWCRAAPRGQSA